MRNGSAICWASGRSPPDHEILIETPPKMIRSTSEMRQIRPLMERRYTRYIIRPDSAKRQVRAACFAVADPATPVAARWWLEASLRLGAELCPAWAQRAARRVDAALARPELVSQKVRRAPSARPHNPPVYRQRACLSFHNDPDRTVGRKSLRKPRS